jgi:ribosome-associated protein
MTNSMTPKEMALLLAKALDSKKGKDILVLETDGVTTLADYFVLCTGSSAPQLKALADAGEKAMKEAGILPHHVEGHRGGTWILQDYGDVVVHLFSPEAREFYDLDRLWQDAKALDLTEILVPQAE